MLKESGIVTQLYSTSAKGVGHTHGIAVVIVYACLFHHVTLGSCSTIVYVAFNKSLKTKKRKNVSLFYIVTSIVPFLLFSCICDEMSFKNYNDNDLKDQGNKLFATKKYDEAIDCYTKAILKASERALT